MEEIVLLSGPKFELTIQRLCFQLIENHSSFKDTVLIGLQPRGIFLMDRINDFLIQKNIKHLQSGYLDPTFHRDDVRRTGAIILPSAQTINFSIENKNVILIDDVLFTGRTIRAGLDAMLAFGRPAKVELLVLINRKYSRHLPIAPDYVGKSIDTILTDKINVHWQETDGEDGVWMLSEDKIE